MNTGDLNLLENFSKINSFSDMRMFTEVSKGTVISNIIDIARKYPEHPVSKQAIFKLAKLDSYSIDIDSNDPVGDYVSYFGVNTSWDAYGGKIHAKI